MKRLLLGILLFAGAASAQISGAGQIGCTAAPATGTAWSSATSVNATQTLANPVIAPQVIVTLDQTTTLSAGAITFNGDYGDGNFVAIPATQVLAPSTGLPLTNPYTLVASTNQPFLIVMSGFTKLQLKLTTAITGSGTITPFVVQLCYNPSTSAMGQAVMASSFPVTVASNQSSVPVASTNAAETTKVLGTIRAIGNGGATVDAAPAATLPTNGWGLLLKGVNAEQTAVTNGQGVSPASDLVGKLIVMPYANPENFTQGVTSAITDTTSTSVIASAGGSLRNYLTSCTATNSHATVDTFVKILDGSTIIYEAFALHLGGGFTVSFPTPLKGTAATAINAQMVTTGTNVIVSCSGYKGL